MVLWWVGASECVGVVWCGLGVDIAWHPYLCVCVYVCVCVCE